MKVYPGLGRIAPGLAAAFVLLLVLGGVAHAAAPRPATTNVLAIYQSNDTRETNNFTVSIEVASTANITFVYFTFCQLTSPVCYAPVAMPHQTGNWYSGTTKPMDQYPGMTTGAKAGYNITIDFASGANETEPQLPNTFANLTTVTEVSGAYAFEMSVAPSVYELSGKVVDAVSGDGIAGAHVALVPSNGTAGPTTTTATTGSYNFTGLLNGTYTLSVSATGYQVTNETVTIANANASQDVPLYTGTGTVVIGGNGGGGGAPSLVSDLRSPWVLVPIALVILALGAFLVVRRRSSSSSAPTEGPASAPAAPPGPIRKRAGWIAAAVVVLLLVAGVGVGYAEHWVPTAGSHGGSTMAPAFTLPTISGQNFSLDQYRNSSVVVIEFTSISCSECQIVEQTLHSLYATFNATGQTKVQIISVYIEPQYGDTIPALESYRSSHNITWTMAQDTNSLSISREYGVEDIPTVIVVDPKGQVVYDVSGVQNANTLHTTINSALAGTAQAISIVTVSVFALAAIAGVTTFFSPCAFPMFPGYMGLFLGLNAGAAEANTKGAYKGAARRAVVAGSVTALGMILVFLLVGLALILAATAVAGYIPYLLVAVGVVLVALGALLLTNLQYWKIITPLQNLWYRLGGKRPEENLSTPTGAAGKGFHLKLFSYGMGYAAAAAGCVFPVIFSALVAGLALGLLGGIVNILIFSLTAATLMIVVTVMLAMAGQKWVNQLKALTPVIKKVSAVALIVVGVYLIYFFYTAWVV